MTYILRGLAGGLMLTMMWPCDGVLELSQVGELYVTGGQTDSHVLTFSGNVMDSARGATGVKVERENSRLNIVVGHSLGGLYNFSAEVDVPDDVEAITFGVRRETIWTKATGPVGKVRMGPPPPSRAVRVPPPPKLGP